MSTAFRLCRTGMMTIAWIMVLPCLLILAAAIVPIIPWFRIYALGVVPNHTSWLFLWAIVALLIGLLANSLFTLPEPHRARRDRGRHHSGDDLGDASLALYRAGQRRADQRGPGARRCAKCATARAPTKAVSIRGRAAKTSGSISTTPRQAPAGTLEPGADRGAWRRLLSGQPLARRREPALVRRPWLDRDQHRLSAGQRRSADLESGHARRRMRDRLDRRQRGRAGHRPPSRDAYRRIGRRQPGDGRRIFGQCQAHRPGMRPRHAARRRRGRQGAADRCDRIMVLCQRIARRATFVSDALYRRIAASIIPIVMPRSICAISSCPSNPPTLILGGASDPLVTGRSGAAISRARRMPPGWRSTRSCFPIRGMISTRPMTASPTRRCSRSSRSSSSIIGQGRSYPG